MEMISVLHCEIGCQSARSFSLWVPVRFVLNFRVRVRSFEKFKVQSCFRPRVRVRNRTLPIGVSWNLVRGGIKWYDRTVLQQGFVWDSLPDARKNFYKRKIALEKWANCKSSDKIPILGFGWWSLLNF